MRYGTLGLLGFGLAAVLGCEARPTLVPVTGKVTMGGSPVGGAVVVFWKRDRERGRSAAAVTDDKGNFSLNTNDVNGHKELKGALPGYYDVTIDKYPPPAPTDPPSIGALSETQNVLPAKYSRPGSLEARVKEGEPNEFVFNLDADP